MKFKILLIFILLSLKVAYSQNNVTFFGNNEVTFIHDDTCNNDQWISLPLLMIGFPLGAIVESLEDIRMVYLNIEHSNASDLVIKLTCPNGTYLYLANASPGGNADLGVANLTDNALFHCDSSYNFRGTGWNYCWSSSADYSYQGTINSLSNGSSPIDSTHISAGTHFITPNNSFNSLIGCPLNGVWGLSISDQNVNIENGYLFSWQIGINSDLLAPIDLGATSIYTPSDTLMQDSNISVKVRIHNFGEGHVDTIPIAYRLDNLAEHIEYYYPFLGGSDSVDFEFALPMSFNTIGSHSFCAYTKAVGDVQLTNDTICKSIFVKPAIDSGVEKYTLDETWNKITVFPNPSTQTANIQFNNQKNEMVTFILYDLVGNVIQSFNISAIKGKNQFTINSETIEQGVYSFSLNSNSKRHGKIIIVK